jgi:hypothetical protein
MSGPGGGMSEVHARVLREAATALRGLAELAAALKVDPAELAKWMQGQGVPPLTVFLQALDIMSRPRNMSRNDDSRA